MKILKFGGSSVANAGCIRSVAALIMKSAAANDRIAVVVSAYQGVTDKLVELSRLAAKGDESYKRELELLSERHITAVKELVPVTQQSSVLANIKVWLNDLEDILHGVFLVGECSRRMVDYIMSFGERLSAFTIAAHLKSCGLPAHFLDAREVIKADENWGHGKVFFEESYSNIRRYFETNGGLHVVTGFIASTANKDTVTLGRGGSDFTAAILGAALKAAEIEILTDVDGVMTADPRKVPKAFYIPCLTYEEMMELSHFGAKVIYPPTLQPALDFHIPVRIRNTFNPEFHGTVVAGDSSGHDFVITGISSIEKISLLRIEGSGMVGVAGIAMRLFGALARCDINIILITQASSEHTICLAVDPGSTAEARKVIESEFALEISSKLIDPVVIEDGLSIVSVVGENMRRTTGIAAKLFSALGNNGINIVAIAQGSSELNISIVISQKDEVKALNALHDEFFFTKTKSLNLFVAGTGLIASTLLSQIHSQKQRLRDELLLDIRLVGITNTKKQALSEEGLDTERIEELLSGAKSAGGIASFIDEMLRLNLPNTVFVDCTASDEVVRHYERVLLKSIAVVTPNKRAQSGELTQFKRMRDISRKRSAPFLYETSVGAGLPVIGTLNDLLKSGDEIVRIEAVLSGTLSFIFNSFDGSHPFSSVVMEAKQRGFTEPDPREDLSGQDVARKLLILAREAGMALERSEVEVENLVPEKCRSASTVEEFFELLKGEDQEFSRRSQALRAEGKKLCYIGSIQGGRARVALEAIDSSHPFYGLSGSDNIISFTTKRYSSRPLVVQGPGAGAEVTAAGVFADIIKTAHIN
ncbi:MAG: bifunctional aspartate kinase/homoserine dehydrogenase I [Deltaproteobacteria bacterium]|nr:bifunctional aspartate kinase/homoserine dehydrogenase I [Deltaproteobacteria bacterium]